MQNSESGNRHKKTRVQHSLKQVALFSGISKAPASWISNRRRLQP